MYVEYTENEKHFAHVHEALTRSKAAEPLLPLLLSHPSRFLFFLFPVAYAFANSTTSKFSIQVGAQTCFDKHVHAG